MKKKVLKRIMLLGLTLGLGFGLIACGNKADNAGGKQKAESKKEEKKKREQCV